MNVTPIPRKDMETVVVACHDETIVYTTNPSHWVKLKRRVARLGGTVDTIHTIGRKEVGGTARFPADAFSPSRFGLRASPPKRKDPTDG